MNQRPNPTQPHRLRLRLLLALMVSLQGGFLVFLWNLQVVQGHSYQETISRQSLRRVRHPGLRGKLYDRNGIVLADNRPATGIALYFEELRVPGPSSRTIDRIDTMVEDMARILEMPRKVSREDIAAHYRSERLLPLMAWRDLDDAALARWAERMGPQLGVDLLTEAVRSYPYDDLMSQTMGYVGRGGMAQDDEGPYDFYLPEMEGKAGLEKVFDAKLRGEAGGELVRIDVSSYRHEVEAFRASVPGEDVQLTLDARLQRLCERILGDATGSMVVMKPENGEVLALATSPRYNLNEFVPFLPNDVWQGLLNDKRRPLVNRPVAEQYPPGSVIKPFVCLAGLQSEAFDPLSVFMCTGSYQAGPRTIMHCHNRFGHGELTMEEAIERSCNVYMWKLIEETGYGPVRQLFQQVGLGEETGLEVDHEVSGILPTDEWKRERFNQRLLGGDFANISIGQGFLTVTPIQMAVLTSAIANGGNLVTPTLLQGFRASEEEPFQLSELRKEPIDLGWQAEDLSRIQKGMVDVVMSPRGTARSAQVPGLSYAGKTGTAQFGSPGNRRYRSWMIAYAPAENPRIAAVVLIDAGQGSGVDAAPRMKLLMQALFSQGGSS